MGGWVVLRVVVRVVSLTWFPVDSELTLLDTVLDPEESHIHCFGTLGLDSLVRDSFSSGVVGLHGSWAELFPSISSSVLQSTALPTNIPTTGQHTTTTAAQGNSNMPPPLLRTQEDRPQRHRHLLMDPQRRHPCWSLCNLHAHRRRRLPSQNGTTTSATHKWR